MAGMGEPKGLRMAIARDVSTKRYELAKYTEKHFRFQPHTGVSVSPMPARARQ